MNIRFPHTWLKEFLATDASPQKISHCLSLAGPSVEQLTKIKDDYLYDIEVTTNRVDMLSVLGIAREAAAILPQFGFKAQLKHDLYQTSGLCAQAGSNPEVKNQPFPLKVTVDYRLCPHFAAVVIKNIELKPSPPKIASRLEKSGIRSLNNVIDISNYLMRAYGQPVHVFDLDKIKSKMILRSSKPKETITTLDGKKHRLYGGDIVIEDGQNRLIDLCGIMGGLNSSVDNKTKNVLLFVQTYNPVNIRQTSMRLAHRTEAAVIFEKSSDPELVMPVLIQGIQLFKQVTDGQQASQIIDLYPKPYQPRSISLPLQLIKDRLGVDISAKEVDKILKSLGFSGFPNVIAPSWRANDVIIPEDLVEEVARIYGYHRLPSHIMATPIPTNYPSTNFHLEHLIKTYLAGMGLTEIYTNSMVSTILAQQSGSSITSHLKIKNALSEDWLYLRRSLIPSHLQAIKANPPNQPMTFFEIANTYQPASAGLPEEKLQLILSTTQNYSHLKGILELLFIKLHLQLNFVPDQSGAKLQLKQLPIGKIDLTSKTVVIDLPPVLTAARLYPQYHSLSAYPPIIEDLTFTLPEKTYLGPVIDTIKSCHRLIKKVTLTKTYQQNFTFNLTYQSLNKPLTDKLVAPVRKKIVHSLQTKFKAKLVGKL